jgi:hypothetical protein
MANDRPLGNDGLFIIGFYSRDDIAEFESWDAADKAAYSAHNKREGGIIGVTA